MTNELRPAVTDLHFAIFGQIICTYAMNEQLLKAALACTLQVDLRIIAALTARMNATELQKKISALSNDHLVDPEKEAMLSFSDRLAKTGTIRNKIAHSTWAPGVAEDSLRASEVQVNHRGVQVRGFDPAEEEYGLAEFDACATALASLATDILTFLKARNYPGA